MHPSESCLRPSQRSLGQCCSRRARDVPGRSLPSPGAGRAAVLPRRKRGSFVSRQLRPGSSHCWRGRRQDPSGCGGVALSHFLLDKARGASGLEHFFCSFRVLLWRPLSLFGKTPAPAPPQSSRKPSCGAGFWLSSPSGPLEGLSIF